MGLSIAVLESGWRPSAIAGYLLFFGYSIGLTHLLRRIIHRRGWTGLPLSSALMRLTIGSILLGALESALVVGVYTLIEGNLGIWRERPSIAFMFIGLSVVNTIWTVLYLSITTMRHSREQRRAEVETKLALSKAQLRALEAQLNPHFLFNCLNSIRGMIGEDQTLAQDMVTRLANILRHSLQQDRQHLVSLGSELEIVSDYLALESIRFDDRLHVRFDVDEATCHSAVPPMLVQTLVENAIKHGVEAVASGGDLHIRVGLDNHTLRIEVENNGSLGEPRSSSTQIGLANARERLRILYGEKASLQLASPRSGRVAATLLIPTAA